LIGRISGDEVAILNRYLFGPVPSRRLGRSLGIDLIPPKTCTFDCLFCQVGATSFKSITRKEYVPLADVIKEIDNWIVNDNNADCMTLAGSGEPTLHTGFGDVLEHVKKSTSLRTVLLTNSSMMHLPEVRDAAAGAHIVKVSLSAWDQESFQNINRPHPDLRFDAIVDGLISFRPIFKGKLWLEVFTMQGINDTEEAMIRIAAIAKRIKPDCIHLNTVVRPPADDTAKPVSVDVLQGFSELFSPEAEIIADFRRNTGKVSVPDESAVLAMIKRRPCTISDIAGSMGMKESAVRGILQDLHNKGIVSKIREEGRMYYAGR
jgi:wyosine [tRNA(Phe)-imidazoG37] synthetase (radical SAM superfamily)